jgi:hypothetical protein
MEQKSIFGYMTSMHPYRNTNEQTFEPPFFGYAHGNGMTKRVEIESEIQGAKRMYSKCGKHKYQANLQIMDYIDKVDNPK